MRLFSVLPLLGLLLGTRASSHDSRTPTSHRLDVRDPAIDICATVDFFLSVPNLLVELESTVPIAQINLCICLSALPSILETDANLAMAVNLAGPQIVTQILTTEITNQAAGANCVFPENSSPACIDGQQNCGFTCNAGFTPSYNPPACVCAPPNILCNGQCQAGLCPSAQALKKKRWAGSVSCSERGPGWAACGVYGGGPRAWECVNTARDLESCGGCAIPLTPYSPIGKDCSALPGVADVACLYGECAVYRCLPGYKPAPDGRSCIRKYSQFDDAEDVPANAYGLEHVPLGGH